MTERLDIMLIKSAAIIFALAVALMTSEADAADTENCLMCHKYRQLGRIDESGMKRSYFVSESKYAASVHRNVPCRDCHTSITKLPHDPVTEEVNCANECHVKPPFATENFSHKKIMQLYDSSVHGVSTEDSPEMSEAKPTCKYCHLNPLFSDVELKVVSDASLQRCMNCHEEKGVSQAYMHITHRLRHKTSRSPKEIVQMCSLNCHGDTEYMKSLDPSKKRLEAVATYESSIHGKSVSLGSEKAADCISCHATNGIHDIYSKEDIRSTLNTVNRSETCRQCHLQVT
ncbi:MAG: cytochrome C, partial [Nitrospira sp.]|nr:cytochrome C [Nitrospira sp.]